MASISSLQRRVMETTSSAPTQPTNNSHDNADDGTKFEACFSAGLDLSDFNDVNSNTAAVSASKALAKLKSDAAAKIRREEQEEAALERRVAAVVEVHEGDESNNERSKDDVIPRALRPNSQPNKATGQERNNNFIQFQTAAGGNNGDFLSSLVVTAHKTERREMSNKSRMMLLKRSDNSKGKVKPEQRIVGNGSAGSVVSSNSYRRSRGIANNVAKKQKTTSGCRKSVAKKSFNSKF